MEDKIIVKIKLLARILGWISILGGIWFLGWLLEWSPNLNGFEPGALAFLIWILALLGASFLIWGIYIIKIRMFVVLAGNTLGITENGHQRIIPLESISDITHFTLHHEQLFFLEGQTYYIHYQADGQKRRFKIHDVKLFGFSLLLSNFKLFIQELQKRWYGSSHSQRAQVVEKEKRSNWISIAWAWGSVLAIACILSLLTYCNEAGKKLAESTRRKCKEVIEHHQLGGFKSRQITWEENGKEIKLDLSYESVNPGDTLLIEKWQGGLWGTRYKIRQNLSEIERDSARWRR